MIVDFTFLAIVIHPLLFSLRSFDTFTGSFHQQLPLLVLQQCPLRIFNLAELSYELNERILLYCGLLLFFLKAFLLFFEHSLQMLQDPIETLSVRRHSQRFDHHLALVSHDVKCLFKGWMLVESRPKVRVLLRCPTNFFIEGCHSSAIYN